MENQEHYDFDIESFRSNLSPPEADQKDLQAKRERNNKISFLIGQYLLKGYKMLANTCSKCECILVEDKHKNKYCVGCSEIDKELKTANIEISQDILREKTLEPETKNYEENKAINSTYIKSEKSSLDGNNEEYIIALPNLPKEPFGGIDIKEEIFNATLALKLKLSWATSQLRSANGVQDSLQLVNLISQTASALLSIKNLCKS